VILIKEDSVTKGHGIILVVENKSYVLTNYHVIYAYQEDDTIEVKTNKKLTFQGNIIYKDPLYDLALLDFIEISNLDGIDVLNASDEINIESVYNPRLSNASPIVFSGLYKDKDNIKLSNTESNNVDVSFEVFIFQMDSQKGISGSPVFDLDLNLIGIVYAGNLQQGNLSRVYVIPLEKIIEFLLKSS
jgi:S1-C subfamily serine protease